MKCLKLAHFREFCCVFSLQSGVIITIVIFTTIFIGMIIMSIYTVSILGAWTMENFSGLFLSYSHAGFVIIAIYVAFCGAYKEESKLMRFAAIFMLIALLIFLAASIMSYIPGIFPYACVTHRCPDHVWMQDSHWRAYYFANKEYVHLDSDFIESEFNQVWNCRLGVHVPQMEQNSGQKGNAYQNEILKMYEEHQVHGIPNTIDNSLLQFKKEERIENAAGLPQNTNSIYLFRSNNSLNEKFQNLNNQSHFQHNSGLSSFKKEDRFRRLISEEISKLNWTINVGKKSQNVRFSEQKNLKPKAASNRAQTESTTPAYSITENKATFRIRFPIFSLIISIIFNISYLVYLVYTVLTYLAFANEMESVDFEGDYARWMRAKGYV